MIHSSQSVSPAIYCPYMCIQSPLSNALKHEHTRYGGSEGSRISRIPSFAQNPRCQSIISYVYILVFNLPILSLMIISFATWTRRFSFIFTRSPLGSLIMYVLKPLFLSVVPVATRDVSWKSWPYRTACFFFIESPALLIAVPLPMRIKITGSDCKLARCICKSRATKMVQGCLF